MTSLEKLKVLLYGEAKDEFGRTNFPQRLEIAKELEKELKALKIIKEKVLPYCDNLEPFEYLTQEEFDLIKEVLL